MVTPSLRHGIRDLIVAAVIATTLVGCATTFIPISWGMREKVLCLSKQDEILGILFRRYDPERKTLRVDGVSFDVVGMEHDGWKYAGAYRPELCLIYRNLETTPDDRDLRNIMVHEMAHHIWFKFLTAQQKEDWVTYLRENPSRWQAMVRKIYEDEKLHDTEDFAYTVEFPRSADIEELARLAIINEDEMLRWLQANTPPDRNGRGFWMKAAGQ